MLRSSSYRAGRCVATLAVLMAVTACDNAFGLRQSDGVSAGARNQQVVVTNNSAGPIFLIVLGRISETRTDWIACVDEARCSPLQVGGTRVYPYGTLMRDPGEKEVVVRWWHAVRDSSGVAHAGDFGSLIVPLF